LSIESNVGGRADRTGVVRSRRVIGVRVGGLHRPDHAHEGNAKQADDSAQPAPICLNSDQGAPGESRKTAPAWVLDDFTVRWSSREYGYGKVTKKMLTGVI
jgi:hypothetical protein